MNWIVTSTGMKDGFSIKKGDRFVCIKNVVMNDGDIAYLKGEEYISECDGCITNRNEQKNHTWSNNPREDKWWDYFTKTPHPVETCGCDTCKAVCKQQGGDFKIKAGDKFVCTSDVVMDTGTTMYKTGVIYQSDNMGCITGENGDTDHDWIYDPSEEVNWPDHFQRYKDKDYFQSMTEEYGAFKEEKFDGLLQDKRQFESGAVRDTNKNKPFIHCLLGYTRQRFGYHMAKNASKYGENNFMKGIPTEAYLESMDRHLAAYMEGDRSEDHLSAILFGVNGIMLNEKKDLPADYYFNKD